MPFVLSRRELLVRSGLVGCSLAASPLITPISLAAAPWDARLVVIILRGGMDGLDVVQPHGDRGLARLRKNISQGPGTGASDLDGFFSLHASLAPLMSMWRAGDLGFVQAVSTPYRDKRSHFDGQDLLEAGTASLQGVRDGWLNRLMQSMPGVTTQTAYAIGRGDTRLMQGSANVANWSPDTKLNLSPQAEHLLDLVTEKDPVIHAVLREAQMLSSASKAISSGRAPGHVKIAEFAADRLSEDTRIAAFSLNGWDTHRNQSKALPRALGRLADTLVALKEKMRGDIWSKTAVIAMTEFGRTVRENGTGGTDHGTGGVMVLAGGAVRGGQIFGDWPGLGEGDLYQDRDLLPTSDVRAHTAWILRGLTGLGAVTLESTVFPGVDMGVDAGLLL